MTQARRSLGMMGEEAAAKWYIDQGYQILARNWRCRDGELDLIARQGTTIVFCEVKTRSSYAFGSPFEAVTTAKQRRIRRLAMAWLNESNTRADDLRFDVAGVMDGEVEVITAAF